MKALFTSLLILIGLLTYSHHSYAEWPIKQFKVVEKTAISKTSIGGIEVPDPDLDTVVSTFKDYLTNEQEEKIEAWLQQVAIHFESLGFLPPRYDELTSDGIFEVHVFPFAGSARVPEICGGPDSKSVIQINPNNKGIFDNGELTTKGYQDLAHELFHTVQNAYSDKCKWGRWVVEGTAEAIGIETARKLLGKNPYTPCQIGVRNYNRKLYTNDEGVNYPSCGQLDYQALSFWQFLGEYKARKWTPRQYKATAKFTPPDFRYLHNFFSMEHPGNASASNDYAWLDKSLRQSNRYGKNQFGISLNKAYTRFAGTFSSYWKDERRKLYPGGTSFSANEKESLWMETVFSGCPEISVSKDATTNFDIPLEPVAARCFKLNFNNFDKKGRLALTFYAGKQDTSIDITPLAISTNGGKIIVSNKPAEPNPNKIGKMTIDIKPSHSQYFIISNVNKKNPENTISITPTISIVPEIITSKTAKKKKKGDSDSDSDNVDELDDAWGSRSWKGKLSQSSKSPCVWPFDKKACGNVSAISLQLVSDTAHLLDEVTDPNNAPDRQMRIADALKKDSTNLMTNINQSMQEIRKLDGWGINITMPQIQPGYTGTVSYAHVIVQKKYKYGKPDGSYSSINTFTGPCPGGYFPANGKVTITEFTKNSIQGSFTADLVEEREKCGNVTISRTINEKFIITDIEWGDTMSDPDISNDEIVDQKINDVNELLPGLISDEMRENLIQKTKENDNKKNNNSENKKTTSILQECKCTCLLEKALCENESEHKCCEACEPIFNICKGENRTESLALTEEDEQEVLAMREQYLDYLKKYGIPDTAQEQILKEFDEIKSIDQKRIIIRSLPK